MLERRPAHNQLDHFSASPAIFAPAEPSAMARVVHGLHDRPLPVAGMTVGEIRARFGDHLDLHPQVPALLDNEDVTDDVVVRVGQMLVFSHRVGAKGQFAPRTRSWRGADGLWSPTP